MTLLDYLDYFGTAAFAISGAYAAARKGMDIMGVLLLAFIVGNGGGTLRDVLLGEVQVFWMQQHSFIIVALVAGLSAIVLARFIVPPYRLLLAADAIGLGAFVVVGILRALHSHQDSMIALLMGLLTGTGGGILRDLLCDEVPLFLRREIYVLAAFLGGLLFLIIHNGNWLPFYANASLCVTVIFVIRMLSVYFDWNLPAFSQAWFRQAKRQKQHR